MRAGNPEHLERSDAPVQTAQSCWKLLPPSPTNKNIPTRWSNNPVPQTVTKETRKHVHKRGVHRCSHLPWCSHLPCWESIKTRTQTSINWGNQLKKKNLWHALLIEYNSGIKRKELLIYTTTTVDLNKHDQQMYSNCGHSKWLWKTLTVF